MSAECVYVHNWSISALLLNVPSTKISNSGWLSLASPLISTIVCPLILSRELKCHRSFHGIRKRWSIISLSISFALKFNSRKIIHISRRYYMKRPLRQIDFPDSSEDPRWRSNIENYQIVLTYSEYRFVCTCITVINFKCCLLSFCIEHV